MRTLEESYVSGGELFSLGRESNEDARESDGELGKVGGGGELCFFFRGGRSASDIHLIFKKLDRNHDDLVSVDELQWLLESMKLGSSLHELESLAGKKNLNFDEFVYLCNCLSQGKAEDTENDLLKSFEVFDENRDGFISSDELRNTLSILGLVDKHDEMDFHSIIKAYDVNSDGLLDFDEFKKMMS
ncbi:hypothetical protein L6452_03346 [Arctium lappa]|uniref:Uncharacterized protein n=1 Tax=Arctium lappa TaxID=4217 RepID=A0ACB9FN67_ARCLA|nr:hypothetical protein L6452_03346 [Arctium lappa]